MSGNPRKAFLVSAVLVAGAMLMTACQGSDSDDAKGSSSVPPAASQGANPPAAPAQGGNTSGGAETSGKTSGGGQGSNSGAGTSGNGSTGSGSSGSGSGSGSGSNGGSGSDGGKSDKCLTDNLDISALDSTITGDSEGTVAVTFKNKGQDCSIAGYAGVDLKTNAGSLSAQRTGQEPVSIVLKRGESVSFGINYPINDTGGSGVRITDLLVTPPDETKTVTLKWPGGASLPVTDGSGTPVKVGPIGSAGQGG
ncbi:DUF4232 domain-containing protein [Yinghuangia sp. YIM S09857]|uniref:DUF4232 domain-containing protein n=1 Tax=Yinghuangia sp. YIM S09857 TaxID=3436929 RepID=UPI003F53BEF0